MKPDAIAARLRDPIRVCSLQEIHEAKQTAVQNRAVATVTAVLTMEEFEPLPDALAHNKELVDGERVDVSGNVAITSRCAMRCHRRFIFMSASIGSDASSLSRSSKCCAADPTPAARVALACCAFMHERDWRCVAITLGVLGMLACSSLVSRYWAHAAPAPLTFSVGCAHTLSTAVAVPPQPDAAAMDPLGGSATAAGLRHWRRS
jgi:hypothetical protein